MKSRLLANSSQAFFYAVLERAFRARTDLSGRHTSTLSIRHPWFRAAAELRRGRAA